jgi:hypothetical protein
VTRPLWLLDVDGVLNAVGPPLDDDDDWSTGTAIANERRWPIRWSRSVVAEIRRLHETGIVELAWLTTWGEEANDSLRELLDLPELAVAGTRPRPGELPAEPLPSAAGTHADATGAAAADHETGRWWKLDVVRAQIASEPKRRLVWTDDDLVWEPEVVRGLRAFADCLLIAPDPAVGLTLADVAAVERYCLG